MKLVKQYGLRKWAVIAEHMVGRIGKQCRERWQNHLRPDIKKSVVWTDEEEKLIIEAHDKFGNRWAEIAKCVPGRSENSIKNHWNATKRKQTSKRKIRPPERLKGLIQSTVLEEYIKKKYFNKVSTTSNNPKTNNNNPQQQAALAHNNYSHINDIYDHDSTTYFLLETFDEEMNFMKDLFANKDNPKHIINNASNNYDGRNISSANLSVSAQTMDVEPSRENVGNNLSTFYLENNNMAREIPTEEAREACLANETYFCSYVLHGSFGNMG
ncbi:transcription factor myb98 [Phtheirospermum japonicum]|uniref:Transcription factor myb98 n=1 Tax=Phtheirospermum japonicum TaxID=374723 RepID=A0A830BG38_9LAMI|nr:transcription factor myb98 [Phtheirospermum japonicum]